MKEAEDTKLRARLATKLMSGRKIESLNQDSGNTHVTLKTMTLARHMHYIYLTADMIMVTLTTR